MSGYQTFSLDEANSLDLSEIKRFKAEDDKKYRISFANYELGENGLFNMDRAPKFDRVERSWVDNAGYVISDGTPEFDNYVQSLGAKPKKPAYGTIIIVWPLDGKGQLDVNNLNDGWRVHTFVIDQGKFSQILAIHNEWKINEYDLNITCPKGGAQFQKLTFMNTRECALRTVMESGKHESLCKRIIKSVERARQTLTKDLGNSYTLDTLRQRLGGAPAASAASSVNSSFEDDLNSLLG